MSVWLTSVTTHSSPGWPRRTGAGTCPLKVHMSWVTPGAAWVSLFSATRMTWWMVAAGAAASEALNGFQPAVGVEPELIAASALDAVPPRGAGLEAEGDGAAAALPVTLIVRIIPAVLCPGTVHQACWVLPNARG